MLRPPLRNHFTSQISCLPLTPKRSVHSWKAVHFLLRALDIRGQSLSKYRSLIKAMRVLNKWMAAKNRFGKVDVDLMRGGGGKSIEGGELTFCLLFDRRGFDI